jgi:hypothetical protein
MVASSSWLLVLARESVPPAVKPPAELVTHGVRCARRRRQLADQQSVHAVSSGEPNKARPSWLMDAANRSVSGNFSKTVPRHGRRPAPSGGQHRPTVGGPASGQPRNELRTDGSAGRVAGAFVMI